MAHHSYSSRFAHSIAIPSPKISQLYGSERNVLDHILPIFWIGGLGDEFQVFDKLSDRASELMPKDQSAKGFIFPLPVFR
jgi:hypothetical protein